VANIPLFTKRRERKTAQLQAAIDAGVEKALSPALQGAPAATTVSGATYPVPNPSSPFNQTGGNFGANPLPRPPGVFDSLFGPAAPLWPDSLDPLDASGRSQLRRGQYEPAWNVQLVDRPVPWSVLTYAARNCDLVAKCIFIKQDELNGYDWHFGFSKQILQQIMSESGAPNSARASEIAREKYGDELYMVQRFFECPDRRMGFTFRQWLSEAIFNLMAFDAWVVYPQYTLGGKLESLSNIDPQTIKVLRDNQGFIPRPPAPAYQQVLYGFPRNETQAEDPNRPGVKGQYLHDQLAYYLMRPTPHSVYGFSPVEESLPLIQMYLARQKWLNAEYTNGATPKLLLKADDKFNWTPEQAAYYENVMNDRLAGQITRRQMAFLLPAGLTPEQMKGIEEVYRGDYDSFIIGQLGSRFGVPMTQLGIQAKLPLSSQKNLEGEQTQSEAYSSAAIINFITDCINDLARRFLGVGPEITIQATNEVDSADNVEAAQTDTLYVGAGIMTRNEIRNKLGLPVIDGPEADELAVTVGNEVVYIAGQLALQQAVVAQNTGEIPDRSAHPELNDPNDSTDDGPSQSRSPSSTTGAPKTPKPRSTARSVNPTPDSVVPRMKQVKPKEDLKDPVPAAEKSTDGQSSYPDNGHSDSTPEHSGNQGRGTQSDRHGRVGNATSAKSSGTPETDASAELAAFYRFCKARVGKQYRTYQFAHQSQERAAYLNDIGASGNLDDLAQAIAAPLSAPAAKSVALVPAAPPVPDATDIAAKAADIVVSRISQDLRALTERLGLVADVANFSKKQPDITVNLPEMRPHFDIDARSYPEHHIEVAGAEAPVVHVDATSTHVHNVDATATHNITVEKGEPDITNVSVAAPEVHVAAPEVHVAPAEVTLSPTIKVPKSPRPDITVNVEPAPRGPVRVKRDEATGEITVVPET